MILSAQTIRRLCATDGKGMVFPFYERTVHNGMTFGLGPAGYDIRIAENVAIEPGGAVLASAIEKFKIPDSILAEVKDKSSWAREFIVLQNTVIEPGYHGSLTLELTNHGNKLVRIEAGSPIAQILFMRLDEPTEQPYTGKYQNQESGPQVARYEKPAHKLTSSENHELEQLDIWDNNLRIGYLDLCDGDLYIINDEGHAEVRAQHVKRENLIPTVEGLLAL